MLEKINSCSEWLTYETEEDKADAKDCLEAWRKFMLRKIQSEYQFTEESWIDHHPWTEGSLHKPGTLALRLMVKDKEVLGK